MLGRSMPSAARPAEQASVPARRRHAASPPRRSRERLQTALAVLNGVLGDHLHTRGNGLALRTDLVRDGRVLTDDRAAIARACRRDTGRVCVLLPGLGETERVWGFAGEPETTYGTLLQRDLGFAPFHVRYNSGLHISENGERLDLLLERLARAHPGPLRELVLIGHSMGGLVARSACHAAAGHRRRWLGALRRVVYIATPHLGAPLEKLGNVVGWTMARTPSAVARLVGQVLDLRSAGVKDLAFANLAAADWRGADPDEFLANRRTHVPFTAHAAHHAVVGTLAPGERSVLCWLLGDGLVRVPSASGASAQVERTPAMPGGPGSVRVFAGLGHQRLARDHRVYAQLRAWCAGEGP